MSKQTLPVDVREVQIGYPIPITEHTQAAVVTRGHKTREDMANILLENVAGETLRITLSTGKKIEIELFERNPGFIRITSDGTQMRMLPDASNSIYVGHDRS